MNNKELCREIFKKINNAGNNFWSIHSDTEVITDSEVATDSLLETLYNMGLEDGVDYRRNDELNDDVWISKFTIL